MAAQPMPISDPTFAINDSLWEKWKEHKRKTLGYQHGSAPSAGSPPGHAEEPASSRQRDLESAAADKWCQDAEVQSKQNQTTQKKPQKKQPIKLAVTYSGTRAQE